MKLFTRTWFSTLMKQFLRRDKRRGTLSRRFKRVIRALIYLFNVHTLALLACACLAVYICYSLDFRCVRNVRANTQSCKLSCKSGRMHMGCRSMPCRHPCNPCTCVCALWPSADGVCRSAWQQHNGQTATKAKHAPYAKQASSFAV